MNLKQTAVAFMVLAVTMSFGLSGCGKSKKQLNAEAAQKEEVQLQLDHQKAEAEAKLEIQRTAEAEKSFADEKAKHDVSLISQLQTQTAQQLKDPASAQFQNVHLNTARTALCGQINAKNSYGGYVGFRNFITTDKGAFVAPEGCGSPSMPLSDMPACAKYAMAINQDNTCN